MAPIRQLGVSPRELDDLVTRDRWGQWCVAEPVLSELVGLHDLHPLRGEHEREHMQAFYVGKAGRSIESRLVVHRSEKAVSDTILATYVSIWPCSNHVAKYIEQLLLDTYDFPLNTSENDGTRRRCHQVGPGAWN